MTSDDHKSAIKVFKHFSTLYWASFLSHATLVEKCNNTTTTGRGSKVAFYVRHPFPSDTSLAWRVIASANRLCPDHTSRWLGLNASSLCYDTCETDAVDGLDRTRRTYPIH
jgi:hypothetical protein